MFGSGDKGGSTPRHAGNKNKRKHEQGTEATPSVHTLHLVQEKKQIRPLTTTNRRKTSRHEAISALDPLHPELNIDNEDKSQQTQGYLWTCPYCAFRIDETTNAQSGYAKRCRHLKTRHPERKPGMDDRAKPRVTIITATKSLPADQRSWTCIWCNSRLPTLPRWRHKKTVIISANKEKRGKKQCWEMEAIQEKQRLRSWPQTGFQRT